MRNIGLLRFFLVLLLTITQPALVHAAEKKMINVRIEQRKVVEPKAAVRVVKGDAVTLRWQTDEKVALHMHGYDLKLYVEPGRLAEMRFDATVSGRYPVTSHGFGGGHGHGHEALLYIEVYPE